MKSQNAFTLIEVMITVVIVAILTAVAMPIYTDFLRRGRITEATSELTARRLRAEQYFQDNRTYVGMPECAETVLQNFTIGCPNPETQTTFTIRATGNAGSLVAGFIYTINQNNQRQSPFVGTPSGWTPAVPDNCWVTSRGGKC